MLVSNSFHFYQFICGHGATILADITKKNVKRDGSGIPFLFLDQLEVLSVKLSLSPIALVPSKEHPTDSSIARIAGHPNLTIVIYLTGMIPVSV
jgi:hypothetical protein